MIDERTRKMIEKYLPNPPDPSLEPGSYYWLQYMNNGKARVITVYPLDVLPAKNGTEYGIYQQKAGRLYRVDVSNQVFGYGVQMHDLYDNRQDCQDQTHMAYDDWERLRKIQKEEGLL